MSTVPATSNSEDLRRLADEIRAAEPAYPSARFAGRGIVICAGGARLFTNAYVLIRLLRETLGCALPIEVWHFGVEEISPAMAAALAPLQVELVDAQPQLASGRSKVHDGWQLKAFALLWSRFAEILLLDADQVPVTDPAATFDWPQYREAGAVFWPDAVDLRADNPVWATMGLPARRAVSLESGQLLVNKARHWRALSAALRLNEAAEQLYQLIYGDKDTYLLAWELTEAPFALIPQRPYIDERVLVQRDFDGHRLFQHRTNAKWSYGGPQQQVDGFMHEAACLSALEELRRQWGGSIFNPPDRTAAARQLETELVQASPLLLDAEGDERVTLDLRPYAEIGIGRSYDRQHWWIEEADGVFRLLISDGERRTYQLERQLDDHWQGRRLRLPMATVQVRSVVAHRHLPAVIDPNVPGLADELVRAASADDAETLVRMLVLLARVTPAIVARVRWLADAAPGDARLQLVAGRIEAELGAAVSRSPARRDVLAAGYVEAGDLPW